jgi:hypothetical protein
MIRRIAEYGETIPAVYRTSCLKSKKSPYRRFLPYNCQSRPDNRDFYVTDGAKIHKYNRLLTVQDITEVNYNTYLKAEGTGYISDKTSGLVSTVVWRRKRGIEY